MNIEDNLKKAEDFYKKTEDGVYYGDNKDTPTMCLGKIIYSNLALYHQNEVIIQLLDNILKSSGVRDND